MPNPIVPFPSKDGDGFAEVRAVTLAVLAAAIIATAVLAVLGIDRLPMLVLSGILAACAVLTYWRYTFIGSWLALTASLFILSNLLYQNNGIRDTALLGLVVVLVAAGLLAGRVGTLVFGLLIVVEIGVYSALEAGGIIVNPFSGENRLSDYISVSLAIGMITALQWLVISRMNTTIRSAQTELAERKKTEEQLTKRLAELQAVHGVSETLTRNSNLQKLIHETGEQIRLAYHANNVLIAIHDPATNLIHFPYDFEDGILRRDIPIRYGEGMTSKIMELKKPLVIDRDWRAQTTALNAIYTSKVPIRSSFSAPIMTDEQVIGVITLENTEKESAFSELDTRPLLTIAASLAVAIEKTRLQDSVKKEMEIQERLIRELEGKNEELERFTYTASHDLKSPLITIRGFLGYLEQDARSGNFERLEKDLQRVSEAAEKMQRLLGELLELSRIGRVANEKQDVPFESIVTEALKRVEGQLEAHKVTVRVGGGFPIVHVDRERIIEVVQNLVDNAVKFMGSQPEPRIDINFFMQDDRPVFFVRDNGIGIKNEFHKRIFGLFDKLDPVTEGTGVGLALIKRIVDVHGGAVWVESDEGAGATFYFTLG